MAAAEPFEDEILPGRFLFSFLRLNGDPTGSVDLAVDGDAAPQMFEYVSPVDIRSVIHRVHILYYCKNPRADKFGGLGSGPLTNGILIDVRNPGGEAPVAGSAETIAFLQADIDTTSGETTIKRDGDWGLLTGRDVSIFPQTDIEKAVMARWTLRRAGHPLHLAPRQRFCFTVQDDLSGLDPGPFKVFVQGATYLSAN